MISQLILQVVTMTCLQEYPNMELLKCQLVGLNAIEKEVSKSIEKIKKDLR
jgi:hypothetical protein